VADNVGDRPEAGLGEVAWLGRYPVKSMRGEELTAARVGPAGIEGDRRYALIDDETGLVASAKHPRKWAALLGMTARFTAGDRLDVILPGGAVVSGDDPEASKLLSAVAGRPVRLTSTRPDTAGMERLTPETEPSAGTLTMGVLAAATPGDNFVDYAAVHVITTATLDALGADPRRFRPNVIIRTGDATPFAENGWVDRTLRLGQGVRIRILTPTPRCAVPTLAQGDDLPADPGVLRTAARLNRVQLDQARLTCAGAYGVIEQAGDVRVGDRVAL
jgi:uncharacterized protein YcbX